MRKQDSQDRSTDSKFNQQVDIPGKHRAEEEKEEKRDL